MNDTFKRAVASMALLATAPVIAQGATASAGAFRPGWYVAPMATYMLADSARCNVDGGVGGSVAFGHRGDFASLEIWGQFLTLSHGSCTYTMPGPATEDPTDDETVTVVEPAGDVRLNGGGLALVVGPFFEGPMLARMFGVIGVGVIRREDHPHYAEDDGTIFGDLGIGYLQPLALFGIDTSVRLEARYRYDVQQPPHPDDHDPAPPHAYEDVILNVGLQIPLSKKPEPLPEKVEPVAMVAVADADKDGVVDETDRCPDSVAGATVDETGCTPPPAEPAVAATPTLETAKPGDTIVLAGVHFEVNADTLTPDSMVLLDTVALQLAARPQLKVEVGGHTDSTGEDHYNQDLSQRRAESVRSYLVEHGVEAERLDAAGYGESQPVAGNDTAEGRASNRRVALRILE